LGFFANITDILILKIFCSVLLVLLCLFLYSNLKIGGITNKGSFKERSEKNAKVLTKFGFTEATIYTTYIISSLFIISGIFVYFSKNAHERVPVSISLISFGVFFLILNLVVHKIYRKHYLAGEYD
jgi:hypothetical protein